MTSTVELVKHYQRSIDRAMDNEHRLLHCIEKLNKLNVTVDHLQETGIGRTVNNLRKNEGEVGYAARALVAKWKTMVAVEENQKDSQDEGDQETANVADEEPAGDDDDDDDDADSGNYDEHLDDEEEDRLHIDETENIEPELEKVNEVNSADHHSSSKNSKSKHDDRHRHRSDHKSDKKHSHKDRDHKSSHREHKHSSEKIDKRDERHGEGREIKCEDKRNEKHCKEKSSHKNKEISDRRHTENDSDSKEHKQKSSSSSKSSKSHNTDPSKSSKRAETLSKHHSSSSNDESSSKEKSKSEKLNSESSDKKSKSKSESSQHHSKESKEKLEKSKSSSSSSKTSNDTEKSNKKRKKDTDEIHIDSTMGASFAEALGMLDMPSSSKPAKKVQKDEKPSTSAAQPSTSSNSSSSNSKSSNSKKSSSSSSSKRVLDEAPDLLSKRHKLEPLPDIVAEIPPAVVTISNNYKPMPLNPTIMECVFQNPQNRNKPTNDEEAFQSKSMKTKVFSGNKMGYRGKIPTLFDMCIHVLQDNIDFLEYTGGVPFDILKPVIERATVEQLMTLEDYNPYLIEDTDCLWEQHCKRRFRGKRPEELESWREMFFRCFDEEQVRFKSLTENIKLSREKSLPVRKTKLAYVDSVVKPPRGIAKKQVKYGTDTLPTVSPAARVESLNGVGANVAKLGDTRLKVAAAIRESIPNRKKSKSYDDDPDWTPTSWYRTLYKKPRPEALKVPIVKKTIDMIRYDRAKAAERERQLKKLKKISSESAPD